MTDSDVLASIPLFSKLSKKDLSRLRKAAHDITYDAGTKLTTQDEAGRFFFIILEGQARVEVQGQAVRQLSKGDYFGEMALIDRTARAATVTAETPLHCLTLTQMEFRPFATEHPDVAWALLEAMVERVRDAERRNAAG
jgi:CRP/FNR family transcriptional regulator, cyclic AMP receptor protein